jgi:putative phosphoesterase
MRVAVISDIHGNCLALDAALADLESNRADQIVCLGDAVQGGPQPAEVVARLRDLGCPVVMGNADAWLLTGENTSQVEEVTERQLQVRSWSLAQLSGEDVRFIETFQPTVEVQLEGGKRLLCFHGSPYSFDDIILPETPEEVFRRYLGEFEGSVLTGGHTHLQQIRRLGDLFFFNPGSVGVAYNRHQPEEDFKADPWAEYAVLSVEGERISLDFRRVPLDAADMVRVILTSSIPHAESMVARYR